MSGDVDLSALRMDESARRAPRRPLGPRLAAYAVALLVLGTLATFLIPWLRPRRAVATAAVAEAGRDTAARAGAAEAAGWVEPDPYPVVVRPLVRGLVAELLVLPGDEVRADKTVVARLRAPEVDAACDLANARLQLAQRRLEEERAALAAAAALLKQKGGLRRAVNDARGEAQAAKARVDAARAALDAAKARRDVRAAEVAAQERLAEEGGSYAVALARARAALRAADAELEERRHDVAREEAALAAATGRLALAQELHDAPHALQGAADAAATAVMRAESELMLAREEARLAEQRAGWKSVLAPADGVVLKLLAVPGAEAGPESGGLVEIYDPERMQARVDVPLASAGAVAVGQKVEVRSEVLGTVAVAGVVTRIERESDLLKNTLQVKVRLEDPPPLLRPETLCRARFLAEAGEAKSGPLLFRVPRAAVRGGAVFVFDPTGGGRARRVAVEVLAESEEGAVVRGPLSIAQRVIVEPVEDGERVEEKR